MHELRAEELSSGFCPEVGTRQKAQVNGAGMASGIHKQVFDYPKATLRLLAPSCDQGGRAGALAPFAQLSTSFVATPEAASLP